jgi:hypothetical protein
VLADGGENLASNSLLNGRSPRLVVETEREKQLPSKIPDDPEIRCLLFSLRVIISVLRILSHDLW